MSDFSLFGLFAAGLACMVPFANAYTQPVGNSPIGNPIALPGSGSIVPVGKPYTITWDPTTPGTVTLLLLKGAATDLHLQTVIVEMTANDGKYDWIPSADLEPTTGAQGYGIQLIVDEGAAKGQYQYTTQFGISNAAYDSSASNSSSSSSSASASAYSSSSSSKANSTTAPSTSTAQNSTATVPAATGGAAAASASSNGTAPGPYFPKTTMAASSAGGAMPTSYAGANATATGVQVSTGGAANLAASAFGLVFAAGVAVLAF